MHILAKQLSYATSRPALRSDCVGSFSVWLHLATLDVREMDFAMNRRLVPPDCEGWNVVIGKVAQGLDQLRGPVGVANWIEVGEKQHSVNLFQTVSSRKQSRSQHEHHRCRNRDETCGVVFFLSRLPSKKS
ncbi:hypothetical protein CB1_000350047 [Camelus ferus]|nr:hypothetical protein CB1_000350047 [Camelus ferus]